MSINFTSEVRNIDSDDDQLVTREELKLFLNKILLRKQTKGNYKKIIIMVVQALFSNSFLPIKIGVLENKLKEGIRMQQQYDENTSFMRKTFSRFNYFVKSKIIKVNFCFIRSYTHDKPYL